MRRGIAGITAAVLLGSATLALSDYLREQDRMRIIRNSHRYHVEDIGLDCGMCHTSAAASVGQADNVLPTEEDCAACHDVETQDACGYCHKESANISTFLAPEREIAFNHALHVEDLGVECTECHLNMPAFDYSQENAQALPEMALCMGCHDDATAPMECELCHLNTENLRPEFHTASFLNDHGAMARMEDQQCAMCHKDTWCEQCHQDVRLVTTGAAHDRYADFGPMNRGRVGQIVRRVHQLNYRFVHQVDAKGKERECFLCHESTETCTDCHRPDDNRFMPVWHQGADWAPSRVLGGRHADYARRDLERCIACHDTFSGQDPVCARCHVDNRR